MILINDIWHTVRDLEDISNLIREYYNRDLADEIDKLIPVHSDDEYDDLLSNYNDTSVENMNLSDELNVAKNRINELEDKIAELDEKLEQKENGRC